METIADRLLRMIEQDAREKARKLSRQILPARPQDKEEIMAGIEIERWLADSCGEILSDRSCQNR
jgi:hypothetical protein